MYVRSILACLLSLCILTPIAAASTQADLEKAAELRKIAFVLVTEPSATGVDQARDLIRQAMQKVPGCTLVELDRSLPANADLVSKYRLAGSPVPLVLVAGRSGVVAGGLPAAAASAERLVALVPSPKKETILQALESGKAVFICAGRKSMDARSTAVSNCSSACDQSSGKCVLVEVDMDDPAETNFLKSLKVDLAATEPVTLVVNATGQIAGTYVGAVDVAELVQATTKKVGGCCPATVAGGSKACPPQKK
jgi:hypothetical protein